MMRAPVIFLVSSVALSAASGAALAEPGGAREPERSRSLPTGDPAAAARGRYRHGVDEYRRGNYEAAIGLFILADSLVPSAALSYDIARAYEKLGDRANAIIWYRDYLHRAGFLSDRADVEKRVAELETSLAASGSQVLSVASTPVGAALAVDGRPVGTTPWKGRLPTGSHHLELRLPGHAGVSQAVSLEQSSALDIRFSLSANPADAYDSTEAHPGSRDEARGPTRPSIPRDRTVATSNPLRTWAYVIGAAGGTAVAGGVVFEILRRRTESRASGDPTQVGFADKYDTMERQQTASRVLLGTGAGLLATGGVLLLMSSGRSEGRPTVSLGYSASGLVANVGGGF